MSRKRTIEKYQQRRNDRLVTRGMPPVKFQIKLEYVGNKCLTQWPSSDRINVGKLTSTRSDKDEWLSTESGSHFKLSDNGKIKAGFGGKFTGQNPSEAFGNDPLLTGASGAIPRSDQKRMESHAKLYYDEIRKRKGDVSVIAKNSGMTEEDIEAIKNHVFINEYDLGGPVPERFYPSYDMAISWQRLIEGKDIQEMDIVMLKHELLEYGIMRDEKLPYSQAHDKANERYNYEEYCIELDRRAGVR